MTCHKSNFYVSCRCRFIYILIMITKKALRTWLACTAMIAIAYSAWLLKVDWFFLLNNPNGCGTGYWYDNVSWYGYGTVICPLPGFNGGTWGNFTPPQNQWGFGWGWGTFIPLSTPSPTTTGTMPTTGMITPVMSTGIAAILDGNTSMPTMPWVFVPWGSSYVPPKSTVKNPIKVPGMLPATGVQ